MRSSTSAKVQETVQTTVRQELDVRVEKMVKMRREGRAKQSDANGGQTEKNMVKKSSLGQRNGKR